MLTITAAVLTLLEQIGATLTFEWDGNLDAAIITCEIGTEFQITRVVHKDEMEDNDAWLEHHLRRIVEVVD